MPSHHKLEEEYMDADIVAAGTEDNRKGPLFRSAIGSTKKLGERSLSSTDVFRMNRSRASRSGAARGWALQCKNDRPL